jgi:S1-C subfamily serine protease
MRRNTRLSVLVLALSMGALMGQSQAQDNIRTLDKKFREVAKVSIPKTVLIKSYVGAGNARAGYGTGAIISKDGYILTCSHVIDIATRVEVVLADKSVYKAKVLGKNKRQDYALLKIEPKNELPVFEIGDSAKVTAGQWVVALGHPGGPYADRQPAFAAGRVTRLHCKLPVQFMQRYYSDAIQTDCPIYAGNSGGPLVGLDGKLLGLNGAILQINDNAYAVPINQVIAQLKTLKAGQDVEGEKAGPEAFAEMQKHMNPGDMNDMQKRMMEQFGKMFGGGEKDGNGGENPLGKIMEQFGKMFGGQNPGGKDGKGKDGQKNPFGDLFGGGKDGQGLDLNKMMEQFGKMFGGNGKDGQGKPGEGMDLGKLLEQFGKMFGGENPGGNGGKNPFGDLFGQGQKPKAAPKKAKPEKKAPAGKKGYLGIAPASDSDQQELGGVLIGNVVKNSPASKGDVRKGDIIISVNGKKTPTLAELKDALAGKTVGAEIEINVIRSRLLDTSWVRSKVELNVTLGERR